MAQPVVFSVLSREVSHDQSAPAATHRRTSTRHAPTHPRRGQRSFTDSLTSARVLLANNAGLVTAILFGLLVTLVGLTELHGNKPAADQSIADWIGFFAWGFAVELTGITTAQAAIRLVPSSGTSSGGTAPASGGTASGGTKAPAG